jgi:hypothetical protein
MWIAIAAVAVAAVLAVVVVLQRPSGTTVTPTTTATGGGEKPPVAPSSSIKLVTEPDGAKVTIDGRDVGLTPADVAVEDLKAARVRVSKAGYRSADVHAAETEIRNGVVRVRLDAAAATMTVALTGSYPFEVIDGGRVISAPSTRHDLSLPGPRVLRLRAPEFLLDVPFRAEAGSGRVSYTLPAAGTLNVRSSPAFETCTVSIDGREMGYPPIANQKLAAGGHRLQLTCPDGTERKLSVSIAPGEPHLEVVR